MNSGGLPHALSPCSLLLSWRLAGFLRPQSHIPSCFGDVVVPGKPATRCYDRAVLFCLCPRWGDVALIFCERDGMVEELRDMSGCRTGVPLKFAVSKTLSAIVLVLVRSI